MESDTDLTNKARRLHIPLLWIGTKDTLPPTPKYGGYIINLQDDEDSNGKEQHGTHWTALWVDKRGHCGYSDSFGFPPPAQVQLFLKHKTPYPYTKKQIQSVRSGWCGDYALYFLYYMSHDIHHGNIHEQMKGYESMFGEVNSNLTRLHAYLKSALKKEDEKITH